MRRRTALMLGGAGVVGLGGAAWYLRRRGLLGAGPGPTVTLTAAANPVTTPGPVVLTGQVTRAPTRALTWVLTITTPAGGVTQQRQTGPGPTTWSVPVPTAGAWRFQLVVEEAAHSPQPQGATLIPVAQAPLTVQVQAPAATSTGSTSSGTGGAGTLPQTTTVPLTNATSTSYSTAGTTFVNGPADTEQPVAYVETVNPDKTTATVTEVTPTSTKTYTQKLWTVFTLVHNPVGANLWPGLTRAQTIYWQDVAQMYYYYGYPTDAIALLNQNGFSGSIAPLHGTKPGPTSIQPLDVDFLGCLGTDFSIATGASHPLCTQHIQTRLNQLNGAGLAVDGDFGPLTEAAVKAWERRVGLSVDGVVGPQVLATLS